MKTREIAGRKPRLVVVGGGTGLAVMLRGLKELPVEITAIVTVADDGGSSGRIRTDLRMPPPGDIRNVLVALADTEPLLEKVLQHRFRNGNGLAGHNLGNLMIAALKEITGDFNHAIQYMSRVLAVRGQVLPSTEEEVVLCAEMDDGTVVKGESLIPKAGKKVRRVYLEPEEAHPLPEALKAIEEADGIIIGPGSLYTSILPNLLVKGMAEAIHRSAAKKIYICNVMTQAGETDDYTASDHVSAIVDHVGEGFFDVVIVNNKVPPPAVLKRYAEEGAAMVRADVEVLEAFGCQVIADDLMQIETVIRHDAAKLNRWIVNLVHP
ncbi:putative cofD-like protein [Melghirimyces profundicolus]|uniref:Gluconeogenesis factor n=1 Tax=Melghirimyces profundicolus TaxID=1242148 RepID=A0A2T6BU61_9BACL|nr:YvcK family protein [Melghirimyces profundicolus]PTX59621.1 putative cofD-like protein [Melghirimyces profundicolus]